MNTHPKYPTRVFADETYHVECPYYEDKSVTDNEGIWADHSHIDEQDLKERLLWKNGILITLKDANIEFMHGKPITPIKTGIKGRGLLGKFGPNHAADPIVTRVNPLTNQVEFIAAKRLDTNQYCIPGGMVDPGEPVSATLKREFEEEVASECDEEVLQKVFANGNLLYAGPTYNDPRTTDNAWIETYVMHYHIPDALAKQIKLSPQLSENSKVKWVRCDHPNLYGDHAKYVKMAEYNIVVKNKKIIVLFSLIITFLFGYIITLFVN